MGFANILCYMYGIRLPMTVVDVGFADVLRSFTFEFHLYGVHGIFVFVAKHSVWANVVD